MAMEIEIDRTVGSPANAASKNIDIEGFCRFKVRYRKRKVEWAHVFRHNDRVIGLIDERSLRRDSNPRPSDYKSDALPAMLHRRWYGQRLTLDE